MQVLFLFKMGTALTQVIVSDLPKLETPNKNRCLYQGFLLGLVVRKPRVIGL